MALVAVDSKLSVINGGSLSVSDLLENQSGGELWIGRPPGTGYPFSNVTARRITLSGTTNIDYGSLSAELYLNTSRGSTSVTGGSQIQSPTAWISGFHPNNSANVTLSGGGSTWTNTLSMYVGGAESAAHGGGMLTISENAMLDVGDQLKIWAPGVVELNEGTINAATIDVEGTFCGTGTVNGNVVNTGVICPGGSTGTLHIIGDYRQNNNGKLLIEIMSPNEGEFDVLHVDGNVVLDGILEITLAEGFIPDPEQNFLVINSTSMAGSFDRVEITGGGSAAVSVNSSGLGVKFTEEAEPEGPSEGTLFLIVIIVIATVVLSLCIYLIRRLIRH
jgi:T5SS/PEP-CTERM-associated repeat protein